MASPRLRLQRLQLGSALNPSQEHSQKARRKTRPDTSSDCTGIPAANVQAQSTNPYYAALTTSTLSRAIESNSWDECSYDDSNRNKCTALFVANTLWLLSGTPKVFDLAEVCRTAKVFGVYVRWWWWWWAIGLQVVMEAMKKVEILPSPRIWSNTDCVVAVAVDGFVPATRHVRARHRHQWARRPSALEKRGISCVLC
ncbi:hypothetical protein QBC35DRAFT_546609 [Podospora australis]|uniref:Uncharacterized protein n=1 Tax=Podospora australis TaxID=1536484 RepID=A0AAN7AL01_9PEZI|nr:hypothetical protein QBC35DRAFT_546609 [Podospora australis]